MKPSLLFSTALVVLGLAATAGASPPGVANAASPVARQVAPATARDTRQIQRAALTSFRRSPLARERIVGTLGTTTVRVTGATDGAGHAVTAVVRDANGWKALGGKAGRAQFRAVETVDAKTGQRGWKLTAIKTNKRVWQRIHTLEPFAAPP